MKTKLLMLNKGNTSSHTKMEKIKASL